MRHCINQNCNAPENLDKELFCQACGSELLLNGLYWATSLIVERRSRNGSELLSKVFEAAENGNQRILKVLYTNNPKALELFKREAEVLKRLRHPGLPKVEEEGYFAFSSKGSSEQVQCLVMEKIEGLNLAEWLEQRNRPIDESLAINWLEQLTTILLVVHKEGLIHRDIKSSNIMLRWNGQLVLIDFGTVRELTPTYSERKNNEEITFVLSLGTTAPEQERGRACPQSDFFSLARTFVHLLTTIQPADLPEDTPGNPSWQDKANVSPRFANFLEKLMAPELRNRFTTAQEVLTQLNEIRTDSPECPYANSLRAWLDSNCSDQSQLLREQALQDALTWAESKNLDHKHRQFLAASQQERDRKPHHPIPSDPEIQANRWKVPAVVATVVIATLGVGVLLRRLPYCPDGQVRQNGACVVVSSSEESISSGERTLFNSENNFNLDSGVKAFKLDNYRKARDFFKKAVASDPNNPETQIYLNNAEARLKSFPFKLAVVVPVDSRASNAKEILRGVADSQTKFNEVGGLNGRLVEIIIANDKNDKNEARKVAHQVANKPDVLGVIGHNSSEASLAALPEYEKVGLAMVSPTSTSTYLKSEVFFRTVPSDSAAGAKLAEYVKTKGLDKVVIFFDSQSNYSKSLRKAFEDKFKQLGGRAVHTDLRNAELDAKAAIERNVNQEQVQAAILLPSLETISIAISIARKNAELPQGQRLQLLGGDAVYDSETVNKQNGPAVEGLTLAVPWLDATPYADAAEERWKGRVNWATAASYDATQALVRSLDSNATRQTVLENMRSVELSPDETSGDELRFLDGERSGEPRLVQVAKGAPSPDGSQYGFQLLKQENVAKTSGKKVD